MTFPKEVMIVEDEAITQRYLQNIMEEQGVTIVSCYDNADDAMVGMKAHRYEMIIMDINIKGPIDGIHLAKNILMHYNVPIVFISAYSDDATLDEVLELAPYGFITKPFTSTEVLASIKVAYKRFLIFDAKKIRDEDANMLIITEHYSYSISDHILYHNGKSAGLNTKQCQLIGLLVQNFNHTVSFETLTQYIWGEEEIASSALRTLVYNIRKCLPDLPLLTHSKQGYYLKKQ